MSRFPKNPRVIPVLGLLTTLASAPVGAQGWNPGQPVDFDLERGRVTERLPFDVHFFLKSPVDPRPGEAAARFKKLTGDEECTFEKLPDPSPCSSYPSEECPFLVTNSTLKQLPRCEAYPSEVCSLPVVLGKEGDGDTRKDILEIRVPALHPRRNYCIAIHLLRHLTPAEQQSASEAIAASLQAVRLDGSLKSAQADRICSEALEAGARALDPEGEYDEIYETPQDACLEALKETFFQKASSENLGRDLEDVVREARSLASTLEVPEGDGADATVVGLIHEVKDDPVLFTLGVSDPEGVELNSLESLGTVRRHVVARRDALRNLGACPDHLPRGASPELQLACFAEHGLDALAFQLAELIEELEEDTAVRQFSAQAARDLAEELVQEFFLGATTDDTFKQRFGWYVTADIGLAHAWDLDDTFGYGGASVYFSPTNKKAPLAGQSLRNTWRRRVSAIVGLPLSELDTADEIQEGILFDRPVLLGLGVRLTDHLRLTGGAVIFDEKDPDPLIDDTRGLEATPFLSLSIDTDLWPSVRNVFSFLTDSNE
jgi:hypothetical protein